jgi:hypothetical protein
MTANMNLQHKVSFKLTTENLLLITANVGTLFEKVNSI